MVIYTMFGYYLIMNTIYNIYEDMYNSILSKTSTKVDTAKTVVRDVMESYKERYIKIIVEAARLNDEQEDIFRDMVEDAIRCEGAKYIGCQFPKSLVGYLIAASDKKLTKTDFRGFSSSQRDWEFSVDTWRMHFVTVDPKLNLKDLSKIPENEVLNYTYDVVRFGKTIVVRAKTLIYVWIDGLHKVVAMMSASTNGRNRPLDYVVKL